MKTITFYSYKGGVGRTLLLANVAKYLCRFGQRVFALDLDLEAPGLHYKLTPGDSNAPVDRLGVVDYIYSFAVEDQPIPSSLSDYVTEVDRNENVDGLIQIMRAGNVPNAQYWRRLARINWHEVFYSEHAFGVPFFLELKARIEKEFSPDYLLIDSRTGITEIGGVATTVLPDVIVCLLLNNREHLDGAREVLRSIRRTRRQRGQAGVEIVPVVARLPAFGEPREAEVLETVRGFLNEDAPDIEDNLSLPPGMLVLHTEPRLEVKESLLIEGGTSGDSTLFRDYIHLLARVVPAEVFMPHIAPLVSQAKNGFLDDPEKAEKDLVALCELASVPEPHRALLSLCFAIKAEKGKTLDVAYRYWSMTGRADDTLLLRALQDCLSLAPEGRQLLRVPLDFVESVWRSHGSCDTTVGTLLAQAYLLTKQRDLACSVVASLTEHGDPNASEVTQWLGLVIQAGNETLSNVLIARYKDRILGHTESGDSFWRTWARAVLAFGSKHQAVQFLNDAGTPRRLNASALADYYEILVKAETGDPRAEIAELLNGFVPDVSSQSALRRFWLMIDGLRLEPELRKGLVRHMSDDDATRFIRESKQSAEDSPIQRYGRADAPRIRRRLHS